MFSYRLSWPLEISSGEVNSMSLDAASSLRDLAIASRSDIDPLRLQSALLAKLAL